MKRLDEMLNEALIKFHKEGNAMTYDGNAVCFAVIQTSEMGSYDATAAVQICEVKDLDEWGFEADEIAAFQKLKVGEVYLDNAPGSIVVRIN